MRRSYLCILIAIVLSCKSAPDLKNYGVISSEVDSIPTIDTSNNIVRPVTLASRNYHLTNKSADRNISFVCKAYLKGDNKVISEKTEKHVVAAQKTIDLNIDSDINYKVVKYEIVNASTVE
ncbi:hypothetical protein ACVW0P_000492 [Mucilaginibacter sp. UYNi724]